MFKMSRVQTVPAGHTTMSRFSQLVMGVVPAKLPSWFTQSYDDSPSNADLRIFKGFSGIHYAIMYDNVQLLTAILSQYQSERAFKKLMFCTQSGVHQLINMKNDARINVFGNSDPLSLAVLQNNIPMTQLLIQFYVSKSFVLSDDLQNNAGFTALSFAAIANTEASLVLYRCPQLVKYWLEYVDNLGCNLVHVICQFKRVELFQLLVSICSQNEELKKQLYKQALLTTEAGEYLTIFIQMKIDYAKVGGSVENSQQFSQIMTQFVRETLTMARTEEELAPLVDKFKRECLTDPSVILQLADTVGTDLQASGALV